MDNDLGRSFIFLTTKTLPWAIKLKEGDFFQTWELALAIGPSTKQQTSEPQLVFVTNASNDLITGRRCFAKDNAIVFPPMELSCPSCSVIAVDGMDKA